MTLIERDGVVYAVGPLYWPREQVKGKRVWVEHQPCGMWSRPASESEIAGLTIDYPKPREGERDAA